jgi:membrane dipeptidase
VSQLSAFGRYDFGLTAEQEKRAGRLHQDSIIIDALFQGPCSHTAFTDEMEQQVKVASSRDLIDGLELPIRLALSGEFPAFEEHWRASGITAGNREVELATFENFARTFGLAHAQFDRFDWLVPVLRAGDIRRAKKEGKQAGFLSTQVGYGPPPDLRILDAACELGLRMLQLTYNTMTTVGAGCTERTDAGVSTFGAALIARCNQLGIIVDTSHCGRQTTLDACQLSKRPVVASHTSAESVYRHARAKSDEEIRAIADTGGVVCIYAVPFFLSADRRVTIEAMLDHIDHVAKVAGWQHVGIGTDWPLQVPTWTLQHVLPAFAAEVGFRAEHKIDTMAALEGFADYRDFPNITRGLVARGYDDAQVSAILGGNFLRVIGDVCG